MEPRTTLPLEILACIIDLLGAEDDQDIKSLLNLSQACRTFVPLCRKYIFSSLSLPNQWRVERFSNLLSKNPDIARYVRHLHYCVVHNPIGNHEPNVMILRMLKERSSLQFVDLRSADLDWNSVPESIQSSLVFLLQLPTLTLLIISHIKGLPAAALSQCNNLRDFRLSSLEIAPPEVNQVISRSKIPRPLYIYTEKDCYDGLAVLSNYANLYPGGPIVDFSRLQKASFDVESSDDIGHINGLIKVTRQLRHLNITSEWLALSLFPSHF